MSGTSAARIRRPLVAVILAALLPLTLTACRPAQGKTTAVSGGAAAPDPGTAAEEAQREEPMQNSDFDFSIFTNVTITGIDLSSLDQEELSVLYQQARYCQAMTDADIDTLREIVSADAVFTHMSGMQQTREEYFADIEKGRLNYFTIGIENPEIEVRGDAADITYTSVLNANAYGARGSYRMHGIHHYERRDGSWIAVSR